MIVPALASWRRSVGFSRRVVRWNLVFIRFEFFGSCIRKQPDTFLKSLWRLDGFKVHDHLADLFHGTKSEFFSSNSLKKSVPVDRKREGSQQRYNPLHIKMIPDKIYNNIFPNEPSKSQNPFISQSRHHLNSQGILLKEPSKSICETELGNMKILEKLILPDLLSSDIVSHFGTLGSVNMGTCLSRAFRLSSISLPPMPKEWILASGWTRYDTINESVTTNLACPLENDLIFDVEVCMRVSLHAVLAVAASEKAWYAWVSESLLLASDADSKVNVVPVELSVDCKDSNESNDESLKTSDRTESDLDPFSDHIESPCYNSDDQSWKNLIPFGKHMDRLIIGHCISFDRVRILEEYHISGSMNKFLDTLSLHSSVSGLSGQQRPGWMNWKKKNISRRENATSTTISENPISQSDATGWFHMGSLNNLQDCVQHHCAIDVDKSDRDIFVKADSLTEIKSQFSKCISYCAMDVHYTHLLFVKLLPKYLTKCPSPLTFYGMLILGSCYLPTDSRWNDFIKNCDDKLNNDRRSINTLLKNLAYDTVSQYQPNEAFKEDPWLRMLDWTPIPERWTKGERDKNTGEFLEGHFPRPIGNPVLFGKPAWFKKLWDSKENDIKISPRSQIVPYLLRLSWEKAPVHSVRKHGWTYLVGENKPKSPPVPVIGDIRKQSDTKPYPMDLTQINNSVRDDEILIDESFPLLLFKKIPFPDFVPASSKGNVGNLLTEKFIPAFLSTTLSSPITLTSDVMNINRMYSFWISYQARAKKQLLIMNDRNKEILGFDSRHDHTYPAAIIPQLITMGTVTRRAVESLWLTASNSDPKLSGSELKSMITAPKGWVFVGADVDSQELWLSSLMGDAQLGEHGSTALGWMTLAGSKTAGTDLHTRTAKILGITRDQAKVFNYGRIYGAGVPFTSQLLRTYNSTMSKHEADVSATELYDKTKGAKRRGPCLNAHPGLEKWLYLDRIGQSPPQWTYYEGGSESFMFNELERIARSSNTQTPGLNCTISDALLSSSVQKQYMTSRINWIVQSSAVDYLHLLVNAMEYLMRTYKIEGRLSISIHDEVRYLIREPDQYRAALALQIANLWTRAFFSKKIGLSDLPFSVAFFSSVDIDTVLRKEVNLPCVTPTNTKSIPSGQTLNIYQILEKCSTLGPMPTATKSEGNEIIRPLVSFTEMETPVDLSITDKAHWINLQNGEKKQKGPNIKNTT